MDSITNVKHASEQASDGWKRVIHERRFFPRGFTPGMYLNDGIMDPHRLSRDGALSKI